MAITKVIYLVALFCLVFVLGEAQQASNQNTSGDDESCAEWFWSSVSLDLQTDNREQYVEGFGGSITDAVAYNWYKLSEETRSRLISTYFGEDGLGYNMIRIPIGGRLLKSPLHLQRLSSGRRNFVKLYFS
ncbi:unnamed protein product [Pieris macdunnoughi]|uniref:Glucosylceramidase n=1 Tax=Pieris macdunnoughi TaxID=345717 RepID=A0A821S8C2_9NEOP|nr:unnamed protein product [Pieris macdunnoughi]